MFTPDLYAPYFEKIKPEYGVSVGEWIESVLIAGFNTPGSIQYRKQVNYLYAQGNQSYAASIKPIDNLSGTDTETLPGADLQNVQLIPQLVSNLAGKMIKVQMRPTVTLQDSMAYMQRRDTRANLEYAMMLKNQGADLSQYLESLGVSEDQTPMDQNELDLYLSMQPQFIEEMALELGLQKIGEESKLDVLRYMVIKDLIINPGRSGYFIDRSLGRRTIKRLDAVNSGVINFSMYEDGRDVAGNYFLEAVPLEQVRFDAQGQISDDDLMRLRGGYFWQLPYGGYGWNPAGMSSSVYTNQFIDMVLVLRFDFLSTDKLYFNEKDGKPFPPTYTPKKDGVDGKVDVRMVQNLFEGSYICGSGGMIFNYGPVKNAIRQPTITGAQYRKEGDDGLPMFEPDEQRQYTQDDSRKVYANKVYSSFVTYQPDMVQGVSKSPVDRVRPLVDIYTQTWHKFRDAMAMYMPFFYWFNNSALADIITREDGDDLTPDDLIVTAIKRGWLVGESKDLRMQHQETFKDSVKINSVDGTPLQTLWNLFVQQDRNIRDAFGLPTIATGAQGSGEKPGKAVTEMLLQGSDDTFSGLTFAEIQLMQNLWETLMWDILRNGDGGVMGTMDYFIPKGNPDERIPSMKAEVLPQQAKWDQLIAYANESKAQGLITDADIFMLETIDNLKKAQAYLAIKTKRAQERIQKERMEGIRATGEEQRASNQQTHDNSMTLEREKWVGEQKKTLLETQGKLMDTYLKALLSMPGDGQKTLNTEKADAILQQLDKQIQEIYVGISATSPATNGNGGGVPQQQSAA